MNTNSTTLPTNSSDCIDYAVKCRMGRKTSYEANTNDLFKLAAKVYEGISDTDLNDMEEIIHDRRNFFGDKNQ